MPNVILILMLNSLIERVRRNHALEHATLHVLEESSPRMRVGGRASSDGFYLYGELPDEEKVIAATQEAIRRMSNGQPELAVHPRCGTNLVTAGVLGGALAMLGIAMAGKRAPWYVQLPNAVLGVVAGLMLSLRVGPWMQANVTTSPKVQTAKVRGIRKSQFVGMPSQFVETTHD